MSDPKSTLYSYAIIAQNINGNSKYLWQRVGKYKKLADAEKAFTEFNKGNISELVYRIVPYFDGYWWTDKEAEKREYYESLQLVWDFLRARGIDDDARAYIDKHSKKDRTPFFKLFKK